MSKNTEGAIKNGKSRETGNKTEQTKQKHNTICVGTPQCAKQTKIIRSEPFVLVFDPKR
jgi:hypothetical protein